MSPDKTNNIAVFFGIIIIVLATRFAGALLIPIAGKVVGTAIMVLGLIIGGIIWFRNNSYVEKDHEKES